MPPVLVLREEKIGQRDLRLEAAEIRCVDGEGIAEAAIALGFGEIRSRRLDLGDQACLRCGGRGGRDLRLGGLLVSVLAFGLRRLDVHFLRRRRDLLVRRLFLQPRTVIAEPPRRIADRRAVGLRRDIRVRCRLRKTIEREQAERQSQPEPRERRLQDPTPQSRKNNVRLPQPLQSSIVVLDLFNRMTGGRGPGRAAARAHLPGPVRSTPRGTLTIRRILFSYWSDDQPR